MKEKKITISGLFLEHAWRYRWQELVIILAFVSFNVCDILIPWYYKKFFDALSAAGARPSIAVALVSVLVDILVLYAVRISTRLFGDLMNDRTQPKIMNELTEDAYKKISGHSYQFFTNNFSGSLVRKIQRLAYAFDSVSDVIIFSITNLLITVIGSSILLYLRNRSLALIIIVWFIITVVVNFFFSKKISVHRKARAAKDSEATGVLSDAVTNSISVKQFSGYKYEEGLLSKVLGQLSRLRTTTGDMQVMLGFFQVIFLVIIEMITMYSAVRLWVAGSLTLGDFVLIQLIIVLLWSIVWNIQQVFRGLYEALADAQEMVDIMNMPYDIKDAPNAKKIKVSSGAIVFDRAQFKYNETREVLKDFQLDIKPKEKVALVGSSGAGKSTIVKLLFRFYDLSGGAIKIDGQDISKVTQESLRDAIAMVPQDPQLFHRSLLDNIRYGRRDASEKEVIAAAKKAHCHEFISALPDGYKTLVGERGIKLSGGERQRVAIARAILKNAPILVLDEATSSLDSESEALIRDALRILMKNKTAIVIAHRLSTIMEMDRIVVVENGRVIDAGTHQELIERDGTYKKLWEIQAGGFMA